MGGITGVRSRMPRWQVTATAIGVYARYDIRMGRIDPYTP
jgi:hypothetical protein